jgi:ribA/ribD-fused uncharacterized protein
MYHFFYSSRDSFSNFYPAPFEYQGIQFSCSEQFFMYAKAKFFKDNIRAQRILNAKTPATMKKNGRLVQNFDPTIWDQHKENIMYIAIREKFNQNPTILKKLLKTNNKLLVEASPWDTVWGIGLAKNDPLIHDENNWKGQNLLGKLLTHLKNNTFTEDITEFENNLIKSILSN